MDLQYHDLADRICPGLEIAQKSLFLAIAASTAVFNISKAKDVSGKEIEPLHEYLHGLIRQVNVAVILRCLRSS